MSEQWNKENLPENHIFVENKKFVAVTEGTWSRKKQDGTSEIAPKWDFITEATEQDESLSIGVYSSTDKEELKLQTSYDLILKRAVGKDGTFYGFSLKGFAPTGTPINKKEPQSRFQKGLKLNAKAEALKAAATYCPAVDGILDPDTVIEVAQVFEAWLNGEYPTKEKETKPKKK